MNQLTHRNGYFPRIAAVTAGLIAAGAIAGAGVGIAMTLVTGGFYGPTSVAQLLMNASLVGAACGAVLFPVGAWSLMRRVPLGRALLWTLFPSMVGAALGLGLFAMTAPVGIAGAAVGFGMAAWQLNRSVRNRRVLPDGI